MGTLTKVFVVLNVVLTLLLTAGTVVYVNRQQSYAKALDAERTATKSAKADAATKQDQLDLLNNEKSNWGAQLQDVRNVSNATIDQLRQAVAERDANIAQLQGNLLQANAAQKSATDALTVAQKVMDTQNGQIADLRKENLDLAKRNSEDSIAINELTNKNEVVTHQWRDATEQITQLQNDAKNMRETMHRAGISENSPTVNPESLLKVQGVVRSKQVINNVPMATISIGSADQVTKGMQLKVIDPNSSNPFLGYVIVDRVEPEESIGHLTGPRINEIRPGVIVRSQL